MRRSTFFHLPTYPLSELLKFGIKNCLLMSTAHGLSDFVYQNGTKFQQAHEIATIAIARAMASRPKVLLADEPTGALDTKTSYEVMDLIQKINDEGKTILVVTHEPDIAQMCKRVVQLKDGIIIKDEKVDQVLASENVQ